ncbi:MAG: Ldh family oxidoreductase [Bacteroidales bacterium]|nr:Ldh family oxidoreductase [Bacteroidales bacterium]
MPEVTLSSIKRLSLAVLSKSGVPGGQATIIADSIVWAHSRGKGTHGITRLPIYVRKINDRLMSPETTLTVQKDHPAVTVLDAGHGFGQVAGYIGMERCVEKAARCGIGVAGVRKSNNFGAAGFIAELATKHKMIGLILSNSAPAIAPWGGTKPLLGTNPLGFAFPSGENKPAVIFDMATSFAARGKIRLAAKHNQKIPFGWALDNQGRPTDDPFEALKGSMIPIGEHKGYGLSLAIDILAGLLTGAAFGGDAKPLNHPDAHSDYGHLLAAINISFFMDMDEYTSRMQQLEQNVKMAGKEGSVFLPGEQSWHHAMKNKNTVQLAEKPLEELHALAAGMNINERLEVAGQEQS